MDSYTIDLNDVCGDGMVDCLENDPSHGSVWIALHAVTSDLVCTEPSQSLVSNASSSFQATALNNKIGLYWIVPDNEEVEYFTIERSANGIDYSPLQETLSDGSEGWETYESNDYWPLNGINFYKLTIYKNNGTIEVLYGQAITFEQFLPYSLVPNPATNEVYFNIQGMVGRQDVALAIYNNLGKELYRKEIDKVEYGTVRIDLTDFNMGLYIVSVQVGEKVYSSKLIVTDLD